LGHITCNYFTNLVTSSVWLPTIEVLPVVFEWNILMLTKKFNMLPITSAMVSEQ
jgi:hypothetical protein